MKILLFAILLILAGCSATPSTPAAPQPIHPLVEPRPAPDASDARVVAIAAELEIKARRQAQYIEALLSQNEALKREPATNSTTTIPPGKEPPMAPTSPLPPVVAPATPSSSVADEPALVPNADGVIDLAATPANPGEPVNPFAVRATPEGSGREVLVHVSGLIAGPKASAVVNERLVQAGDRVAAFQVEHIAPESVLLRLGERRLRLPLTEKPVRVRLPN